MRHVVYEMRSIEGALHRMNEYVCAAWRFKGSCATAMASMAWCEGSIAVMKLKRGRSYQSR